MCKTYWRARITCYYIAYLLGSYGLSYLCCLELIGWCQSRLRSYYFAGEGSLSLIKLEFGMLLHYVSCGLMEAKK